MSVELVGIAIAAVSALLGWFFGTRNERAIKKQYQLDAISFASSWYADLRAWASEAIELLCEAAERCSDTQAASYQHNEALTSCLYRLSALIDRGRFFLPNVHREKYGTHKPEAYRGIRHPALDYLVAAHRILKNEEPVEKFGFSGRREAIIDFKRQFVSSIQVVLNPRLQAGEINRLVEDSRSEQLDKGSPVDKLLSIRLRPKIKP